MKNVELHISALNASTTSIGNYVMVLQEINSNRRLPIIIGLQEAQSIAVALEQMHPLRPLTHDLLLNTITFLKASLDHIRICMVSEGTYISVIVVKDNAQNLIEIDSRTSDAVALAVRQKCSIYISEDLLSEMAVGEPAEGKIFSDKRGQLDQYSLEELYDILSNLLEKEDYESASTVRDIISKKEQR
ncbi:MAG: bifunctional nuclease family protein [Chitinophagaceae bacterium]